MDLAYFFSSTTSFVGNGDHEVETVRPGINENDKQIDTAIRATLLFRQPEDNPTSGLKSMQTLKTKVMGSITEDMAFAKYHH